MSSPRRCALNTVEKFCNCKTVTILTVFLLLASFSHIALSIDQTKVAIEWRDLIPDDWEAQSYFASTGFRARSSR